MAGIEIDDSTRDTFQALADDAGVPLAEYLARLAEEKEHERALAKGADVFRQVTSYPATVSAFDAEFRGPAVQAGPRAA
ncbi:antitoxin MazE7 [Streptomyces sp. 900105245]